MTRNEFLEDVTTFGELKGFCFDVDCDLLDDVHDDGTRDDYINECLIDWAREDSWQDLWSRLDAIPTGYDWYCDAGYGEWYGLDDSDFDSYRNDVLGWADDNDVWDEDEEEADESDENFENEPEDDELALEEEDFSVGDLISMCVVAFDTIQSEEARRIREEENELRRLYPNVLK